MASPNLPTADADEVQRVHTLGSVRLHHRETNEIMLVPTPSSDPNDPLNWSKAYRWYIAIVTCAIIFLAQFLAAGPSVDMVNIVIDMFGTPPSSPLWPSNLSKAAYLFTTTAFVQGMSNLVYMPLIIKYGRRPVYIISFTVYGACALWAGLAQGYGSELGARIMIGFAGGSAECLAPLTIADTFFLHERGVVMALYSASLACGIALGIIISGFITITQSWRVIYFLATGLIWAITLLVVFTIPETCYTRIQPVAQPHGVVPSKLKEESSNIEVAADSSIPRKKTYYQRLAIFSDLYTSESIWKLLWRPIPLILLPPVLWATLCMSAVVGCFVSLSTNFASALSENYGWVTWQSGLAYVAVIIGSLCGVVGGGWFSDYVADWLTKRNGGIREPEMRLPTMTLALLLMPASMFMYGFGIADKTHWIVPVIGLGFLGFSLTQSTNIVLVYVVDAYRPIAGECVVSQLSYKSAFGFFLSFYVNPWIQKDGYKGTFGILAALSFVIFVMWIPMYIWGKRIRHATIRWKIFRSLEWDVDREVGE